MRISDWSSDVCSSDLADLTHAALEQACRYPFVSSEVETPIGLASYRWVSRHERDDGSDLRLDALNKAVLRSFAGVPRNLTQRPEEKARFPTCTGQTPEGICRAGDANTRDGEQDGRFARALRSDARP